jgi:hypothetical protein
MADFKPQIMPVLYWALAYGALAGFVLFLLNLLAAYVTVVWFPVFLIGVVFGGWRNYKRQKSRSYAQGGTVPLPQTLAAEFREAASDIAAASRDLLQQNAKEEAAEETAMVTGAPEPFIEPPDQTNQELPPETPGR